MIRLLAILALAAAPAFAQEVRPADSGRLADYRALFNRATARALVISDRPEQAQLTEALLGRPDALAPEGDWNCRVMKLGGPALLVVYRNFSCRVTADGPDRWRLEKLSGSQRIAGTITLRDGTATFLGVGYVEGGPASGYASLPPDDQTPVEPGQTHAQVGVFEQIGPDRARLLLPEPVLESDFDILYLTR